MTKRTRGGSENKSEPTLRYLVAINTDACTIWPLKPDPVTGYGRVTWNGRRLGAHRVALIWSAGPPPPGTECAHTCGVKLCVNPRHLRWATSKENKADMKRHGTVNRGERNGAAKLQEAEVRAIRRLREEGWTHEQIAQRFSCNRRQVGRILDGTRWAWLD